MDYQLIIAGTVGKENTHGTLDGTVKAGPMSFARFSTDDFAGTIRGYVGEGAFTNDPLNTFGGAGVVADPQDAGAPPLHLRERLRAPRRRQLLHLRRRRLRGRHQIPQLAHALAQVAAVKRNRCYSPESPQSIKWNDPGMAFSIAS